MSKKASKTEKSIKNQNKVETNRTFSRFYTNFKVITGRKGKKVIAPKFGHYYFFQVYFHAYFFHVFYLNFWEKIQMIFATLCRIYTCRVTWHAAAASKCNFWEKIQIKAWKTKNVKKVPKFGTNTFERQSQIQLQIIFAITNYDIAWMTIQIWFLARKSVLKKMHWRAPSL